MLTTAILLALPGFFMGVDARSLPTRTHVVRKVEVAAAPAAGPTTPLVSDFRKNNVSAKWAEGHPKIWGEETKKFGVDLPDSLTSRGLDGTLTDDGKFLILVNNSVTQVINSDTGAVVSTIQKPQTLNYNYPHIAVLSTPGGGYSVFESYNNDGSRTSQQRLTPEGAATGEVVNYVGEFLHFEGPHFSNDKRRLLTYSDQVVFINDLSDPDNVISLAGHTSGVMHAEFSPDDKYISTTSWDQYTIIWDSNGKRVKKLGPSGGQNWYTNFSPDGKTLLYSVGGGSGSNRIDLVPTSNFSATLLSIPIKGWARSFAWSSDSQLLAYSLDSSKIIVVKASDGTVVQKWEAAVQYTEPNGLSWLEGNKKLAYRYNRGLEIYDFETNLKYRWAPDVLDQYNTDLIGYFASKSKGLIATTDGDEKVRFWPYPA